MNVLLRVVVRGVCRLPNVDNMRELCQSPQDHVGQRDGRTVAGLLTLVGCRTGRHFAKRLCDADLIFNRVLKCKKSLRPPNLRHPHPGINL